MKYAVVCTIIVNVVSLILALGLNSKIKGKTVLRGIYFIPNILGGLVVGYIFSFFFTYILPAVGQALGIEATQQQYAVQYKDRMVRDRTGRCVAVHCHEYDYLYFRSSDSAGGCV